MNYENKVIHGDSLELLKTLEDNSIDLIVTDPPYRIRAGGVKVIEAKNEMSGIFQKRYSVSDGTAIGNRWLKKNELNIPCAVRQGKMFEHNDIKFREWLPEAYRVLKADTHCYIMVNGRNVATLQNEAEKVGFKYLNLLAWVKNNATPNRYYMQQMEFILLLRKGYAREINNMGCKNYFEISNILGKKIHPTEKPVELLKILISNSSNENDLVLDMFCGSGSTLVASKELGRRYLGFEIDNNYIHISCERLTNTSSSKHISLEDFLKD